MKTIRIVTASRMGETEFHLGSALGRSLKNLGSLPRVKLDLFARNKDGLPAVYNRAIANCQKRGKADREILLFIHDDVWITDPNWEDKLRNALQSFQVVGLAGSTERFPGQPVWYNKTIDFAKMENSVPIPAHCRSGAVAHGIPSDFELARYGQTPQECKLLDGLWLAADAAALLESGVRFDERFSFHFYDLDFCRTAEVKGLRMGTSDISVIHKSRGFLDKKWYQAAFDYLGKWGEQEYLSQTVLGFDQSPQAEQAAAEPDEKQKEEDQRRKEKNIYSDWLVERTLTDARRRWIKEEIDAWSDTPDVAIAMIVLPGQEGSLADTLYSLQSQIYPNWHLTIISFEPVSLTADLVPSALVRQIDYLVLDDDEDSVDAVNRVLAASASDWVSQIWPGDTLAPDALFYLLLEARRCRDARVVYCDEDTQTVEENRRSNPLMKPDFNLDLLLSYNYIGQFFLVARNAFRDCGGFRPAEEGAEDYGLLLRLYGQHGPAAFAHAAELLYHRHESGRLTQLNESQLADISCAIARAHLERRYPDVVVTPHEVMPLARIVYPLTRTPPVSILVPTRDLPEDLERCLATIYDHNDYPDVELVLIDHETTDPEAIQLIERARARGAKVLRHEGPFDYSSMINRAAAQATGEFLLLLNNDVSTEDPQWLINLVRHGLRDEVGVVGAKLLYPNGTIQHAGVLLGIGNKAAAHPYIEAAGDARGYMLRAIATQGYSAVTGACLLIRKELYDALGGLDEQDLKVRYQDIDLCLKARKRGLNVVLAADAVLVHCHATTIRNPSGRSAMQEDDAERQTEVFCKRWSDWIGNDPAYNKNLSISGLAYSLEMNPVARLHQHWKPRPRVFAYPIDHWGCGEYRIKSPSRQLARAGLIDGRWSEVILGPSDVMRTQADAFVFQRHEMPAHHDFIDRCRRYSNAFRVLEVDDYMHGINQDRRDNRKLKLDDIAKGFEKAVSMCDRLVVSSKGLAEEYNHLIDDVVIAPNYIEHEKWSVLQPRRRNGDKPRVGWAGSSSHFGDLLILDRVIKALANEVHWVFLGMCPESIRPWVHEYHNGVSVDAYPMKLASLDLDLALAPLEYARFNECKTPLRLLELGILGYPVVCTDIVTFEGDFPVTRVANDPDDWIDAIRSMISDRDQLAKHGDRLRDHIRDHWLLENNLDRWMAAWLPT